MTWEVCLVCVDGDTSLSTFKRLFQPFVQWGQGTAQAGFEVSIKQTLEIFT